MSRRIEDELIHQEIVEQAELARRRAVAFAPEWPRVEGRTLVTGAGDSLALAELARELFPARRLEALPAMSASRAALELSPSDVLVAISVSGRTPRVVEAALRARSRGAQVIALTDDAASPLAAAAALTWCIDASPPEELASSSYAGADAKQYVGYHHDVAQTKTFLAGLLALARAAEPELDLAPCAARVAELVSPSTWRPLVARADEWARAGQAFVLATGSALPLARFAAYKLYEYDRVAHWSDVEEYCHTQYFVTRPGDALVFLVHDHDALRRTREIAPTLVELFGARAIAVRSEALELPAGIVQDELVVPAAASALELHVGFTVLIEWLTYLWGRVDAPDIDRFHAGRDTERLIAASMRTIRRSRIEVDPSS